MALVDRHGHEATMLGRIDGPTKCRTLGTLTSSASCWAGTDEMGGTAKCSRSGWKVFFDEHHLRQLAPETTQKKHKSPNGSQAKYDSYLELACLLAEILSVRSRPRPDVSDSHCCMVDHLCFRSTPRVRVSVV